LRTRIRVDSAGEVTIFTGKVELGQGIHVALAQLVADELDLPFERVRVAPVDTSYSPDEGTTSASRSLEESGTMLWHAAAEMRRALIHAAATRLDVPANELTVASGRISDGTGRDVSYAELAELVADAVVSGEAEPRARAKRVLMGSPAPRHDLIPKITGGQAYVQDIELPGMLHARVVRPPAARARLERLDEAEVTAVPGVVGVVRDGSFLAVVAEREEQAIAALRRARRAASWQRPAGPDPVVDPLRLPSLASEKSLIHGQRGTATEPAQLLEAVYSRPYIAHAAVAPSCAVARRDGDDYTIWAHSQDIFALRNEIAKVLGVAPADVRVIHAEGAGCYGHNGADDVGLDAALVARAFPDRPVRVQWMREDEFIWEPFGPAALVRLQAGLDTDGSIVSWIHHGWSHSHDGRPSTRHGADESALLAAWHLARPFREPVKELPQTPVDGGRRNAVPLYDFPGQEIVDHFIPEAPLRVSSLRSLGAHMNVFAIESFIDEIAAVRAADPVALRMRYLADGRARDVIDAVTALARWVPGERLPNERGRGIGFARYKNRAAYAAVVAEVELDTEVRVRRAWGAIDAGMVVNRDGLLNQLEGGITQAVSWTLHESVLADAAGVLTTGWDTYGTLRFPDAPEVEGTVIDRPDQPPLGAGEAMVGPTSAAIANAVFDALGVRVRDLPLSRERVIAAIG
jgi:CO/xanthine dehydrogenase Mo-binding subunit